MGDDIQETEVLLNKTIVKISNWLSINEQNQKAIKPLNEILEVLDWAKVTLETMPPDIRKTYSAGRFKHELSRAYDTLEMYLPDIQVAGVSGIVTLIASTNSSSTNALLAHEPILLGSDNREDQEWVVGRREKYKQYQEKQRISSRVRDLLNRLDTKIPSNPRLVEEYDYMSNKTGAASLFEKMESVAVGMAMRNLLDHYKGKLFALARRHEKENMTWEIMANRLCKYGSGTLANETILAEEGTWSKLKDDLSNQAKNTGRLDIQLLHTRLLAHLFSVLVLAEV